MADVKARIDGLIDDATGALTRMGDAERETIAAISALLVESLVGGGTVYVCGNGGSAADAQHIAGELAGHFLRERGPLAGIALTTDASTMTAIANDYGYEDIFSRQVRAFGQAGDVLWGLSTSGASANVIAAAKAASEKGMKVVAMTGAGGGALAEAADICFRAPADRTDLIQQLHQLAYHIICELIDDHFITDG